MSDRIRENKLKVEAKIRKENQRVDVDSDVSEEKRSRNPKQPPAKNNNFFCYFILIDERDKELARINNLQGTGISVIFLHEDFDRVFAENQIIESDKIIWKKSNLESTNWVLYCTELGWKLFLLVDDDCRQSHVNGLVETIDTLILKLRKNDYSNNQIKTEMEHILCEHFKAEREKEDPSNKIKAVQLKLELIIKRLDEKRFKLGDNMQSAEQHDKQVKSLLKLTNDVLDEAKKIEDESNKTGPVVLFLVIFGFAVIAIVFINIYIQVNSEPGPRKLVAGGFSPFIAKRAVDYYRTGARRKLHRRLVKRQRRRKFLDPKRFRKRNNRRYTHLV